MSQFASKLFGEAQQLKVHINIIAPLRVGLVGVVVVLIAQTELVSFMGQHYILYSLLKIWQVAAWAFLVRKNDVY